MYETYEEARTHWVPPDAHVIKEMTDDPFAYHVIYIYDKSLHIDKFFPLGQKWAVSSEAWDMGEL